MKTTSIKKLIIMLTILFVLFPVLTNAKTLGQLKKEYNDLEQQYNAKNGEIKANAAETAAARARVESIYTELAESEKEIQNLSDQIAQYNEDIAKKQKQLDDLMRFYQVSQGQSMYLEYIFEASSITDFIYRLSVTEQLSDYNNKLIAEMHELIKKNQDNIVAIHAKEDSLKALQAELADKLLVLASQRAELSEEYETIEDEIKNAKSILDFYTKAGCTDNQDIATCANQQLPASTKFFRPLNSGHVTSEYGYRICPFHGKELHTGIDVSGYDLNVRPIADGIVVKTIYSSYGYGNHIIMHHKVNGKNYSSLYGHLASILVREGTAVTKDQVIGIMGSTGSSTATHLHLNVYTGLYPNATLTDPRNYINFPTTHYVKWNDRTTYCK